VANWITATIVNKHFWTHRLVTLQFEADVSQFKAGQFIRVGMDIQGERVGRPYSLVNAAHQRPHEIYFNIVPGGPLSPRLAKLEQGDNLWVYDMAHGFLTLDEVPDVPDLWMLSTGTAVGPFLSMLNAEELWRRFEHVVLAHAVRTADELSYQENINAALKHHPMRFRFVPFVSRETKPDTIHGRIPASIRDQQLEGFAGLSIDSSRSHVMLCGNSGMIDDAIKALADRGMRRHRRNEPGHITTEKYH